SSPAGGRVLYLKGRDIWATKIDGSEKPAVLIQSKGRSASLHWSPDASMLAFTNSRGDHSYIGVFNIASKSVRYIDPSVDRDSEPVWSRDGKSVAFIRVPASREAFAFGPRRSGEPWSIRIADVEKGTSRALWKADEGPGSVFREIVADDQLIWSADNRIV